MVISGDSHEVQIENGDSRELITVGPLYLGIFISRITIYSTTTVSYILKTLSELDDYMVSIDSNVTAFNELFRLQMDALENGMHLPRNKRKS